MNINFATILHIATDSPGQLRKDDVYRVLDAAKEASVLDAFALWLLNNNAINHNVALRQEIMECLDELRA